MDTAELLPPLEGIGSPTYYSEELLDSICKAISKGATLTAAAQAHGIRRETLWLWQKERPNAFNAVSRARAELRRRLEERFATHALDGEDWRAVHAYLQSSPDTRSEWGPTLNLAQVPLERLRELIADQPTEDAWPTLQQIEAADTGSEILPVTDTPTEGANP